MSINKFLCKHFDPCNQGYVTIFDIVAMIGMYVISGLIASGTFIFVGSFIYPGATSVLHPTVPFIIVLWTTGLAAFCVVLILMYAGMQVLMHKVAECPRKQN